MKECNCDSFGGLVEDRGNLTNKNQLPVQSLNFGNDLGRNSFITFKLGFLGCSGKDIHAVYPIDTKQNSLDQFHKVQMDINKIDSELEIVNDDLQSTKNDLQSTKNGLQSTDATVVKLRKNVHIHIYLIKSM